MLEPLRPEICDEVLLWMDGVRSPFGRVYQRSSNLGMAKESDTEENRQGIWREGTGRAGGDEKVFVLKERGER